MRIVKPIAVYDVEVLRGPGEVKGGWKNPFGMGFGTAVAYFEETDYYVFYGPQDLERLKDDLDRKYVVGFNSIEFDNRVLFGNDYRGARAREDISKECDLLQRVIRSKFNAESLPAAVKRYGVSKVHDGSCSLDAIAKATLGKGKTGSGEHAPFLIRRNQWAKVFAYNLNDVRLTYKLFCFARENDYLVDGKGNKISVSI